MKKPFEAITGVTLELPDGQQIASTNVENSAAKFQLSWDRFVRLKAAAEAVISLGPNLRVLDVGGYDGALSLFLPDYTVDVIDPATTGGSILEIPATDHSYEVVTSIDVLEHIEPTSRAHALAELTRVASRNLVLNYPCRESKDAQELALKLTNNPLIREHVEWELPDTVWVMSELEKQGFSAAVKPHTSIAIWLGQFVTLNLVPDAATKLNRHLVEQYADESFSTPLYHLVTGMRE
jgi:hypothetical protein